MRILKRFSKTGTGQKLIGFIFYFITKLISRSIKWEYFEQSRKTTIFDESYIYSRKSPLLHPTSKILLTFLL